MSTDVQGRAIVHLHWCDHRDGTGVTNFSIEDWAFYEEAIARTGCPFLKLSRKPLNGALNDYCSLHDTYPLMRDLSAFWENYRQVRREP